MVKNSCHVYSYRNQHEVTFIKLSTIESCLSHLKSSSIYLHWICCFIIMPYYICECLVYNNPILLANSPACNGSNYSSHHVHIFTLCLHLCVCILCCLHLMYAFIVSWISVFLLQALIASAQLYFSLLMEIANVS